MAYSHCPKEPIAIIGSGCRFPGNANSPHKLWELLRDPRDLSKQVPESRFSAKGFYHSDGEHHGASNVTKAYFLEDDPRLFDSVFFNIAPREAEAIDPQQRLLLETVYEAMESAGLGIGSMRGTSTSCYVGVMTGDYAEVVTRDPETFSQYMATGTSRALISNRVSYVFDWSGPSMTIDTACSSSLVAIHLAVQSLRSGESTIACAAGSNLILNADSFIGETSLHMISPEGQSRMWDASANGYARGEGVAAVFLKPLSHALKDGDRIEALIRETGVNQDGRTQGITLPNPEAQAALIRTTYSRAGLDLDKASDRCQYFEAHGTGTQAGDPREASAIRQAFFPDEPDTKHQKLHVGSIKTVIGHTEGCAGIAGVLKVALALKNKTIPPNQHFHNLNPSVAVSYKNLCIPTAPIPWVADRGHVLRASVNSFGFGGTNSHAIMESYEPEIHDAGPWGRKTVAVAQASVDNDFTPLPLLFSANSGPALLSMVEKYTQHLAMDKASLHELAATLQARRSVLPVKVSFAGANRDTILDSMKAAVAKARDAGAELGKRATPSAASATLKILGVFTGQGAQWPTMGASLMRHSPLFRETIDALDKALQTLPDGPSWKLSEELAAPTSKSRVREAAISQPACTALQVALVNLLAAAGISFHTVVGHSSGEISSAYAAGFISGADAVRIAYYRGLHAKLATGREGQKGAMMAVGLGIYEASAFCDSLPEIRGRLSVAASNSPGSVTLSGDQDAVDAAKEHLDRDGVFNRVLQVDTAYHSHHMIPCSSAYLESLKACQIQVNEPRAGSCTWISSVHGGVPVQWEQMAADLAGPYWRDNMVQTVLFSQAIEEAINRNDGSFDFGLEVGPHAALKGPTLQTIKAQLGDNILYEGVLDRKRDDVAAFGSALGALWVHLGPEAVDFSRYCDAFHADSQSHRLPLPVAGLPAYPWEHRFLWTESRINKQLRSRRECPHELLGARTTDDSEHEPRWRNILKMEELPWLRDHRIQGQIIVPGAAYCAMALEAAAALARRGESPHTIELRDLDIVRAISIDETSEGSETLFSLKTIDTAAKGLITAEFSLSAASLEDGIMRRVCTGQIRIYTRMDTVSNISTAQREENHMQMLPMNVERFYSALSDLGLGYTGAFRSLSSLERVMNRAAGIVTVQEEHRSLPVHPTWLDACFQTIFAAFAATNDGSLWTAFVPTKIGCIRLLCPTEDATATISAAPNSTAEVTVDSYISSFEAVSPASMPKITADLDIFDGETGERRIEIHDLAMSAFIPAAAKHDRHVFQRTIWAQDILSGAVSGSSAADDLKQDEAEINACERAAYYYLHALQSAKSHSTILEQHPALAPLIDRLSTKPRVQDGENPKPQSSDSIDLQLIRAVGERSLLRGLPPTRRLRQLSEQATPSIESLYAQWQTERLGAGRIEMHVVNAAKQIAHQYPRMKILQIGASPRLTQQLIAELGALFETYTVTVDSTDAVEQMKAQTGVEDTRVRFRVLESDEIHTSDNFGLVLLVDPLAAAESIQTARQMLLPGGFLLMVAPTGDNMRSALVRSGWQEATQAVPADPSPVHIHKKLQQSDFSGIISIMFDCVVQDNHATSVILSQASNSSIALLRQPFAPSHLSPELFRGKLIILGAASLETIKFAEALRSKLSIVWTGDISIIESLADMNPATLDEVVAVVSLTELDRPVFEHLNRHSYAKLQRLLQLCKTMLWVTNKSASSGPYQSAMMGLGRTVMAEDPGMRLQFLDLDTVDSSEMIIAESLLRLVAEKGILNNSPATSLLWTVELELAVKDAKLQIPRVVMDSHRNDAVNSIRRVVETEASPSQVVIALTKSREGFYIAHDEGSRTKAAARSPDMIEIRVRYCSEKSILTDGQGSGLHVCLGTTTDETLVMALALQNASHVVVPVDCIIPIPDQISEDRDNDMAQLVGEAICHLQAQLLSSMMPQIGKSTLIYESDDIFIRILAEYLQDKSVWHIKFSQAIATSGSLGSRGRLIMLRSGASRREISTQLPSDISLVTYLGSERHDEDENLARLLTCVPPQCAVLSLSELQSTSARVSSFQAAASLRHVLSSLAAKPPALARLNFSTVVRAADTLDSSRISAQDCRAIVDWTGEQRIKIHSRPLDYGALFSAVKSYILVGLTGQMGQSICRWMVRHGARHIVVTSRKPPQNNPWTKDLQSLGAHVRIEAADVTRREDIVRLRQDMAKDMPPVAGIMNGAMLLADGLFADMTFDNMHRVLQPKVDGSRNLDTIFSDVNLDFFVMLSSVNAVTGMMGQANYSAANMFMVGLAADRRARGLAASVIDIGMVIGIGIIQRTEGDAGTGVIETNLRRQNLAPISEPDLHNMLAEAITAGTRDRDVEIITGLQHYESSSPNRPAWYKNPRFSHLVTERLASRGDGESAEDSERQTLANASSVAEASRFLETVLTEHLAAELKMPAKTITPDTPIIDLGVDSLVAAGVRTWLLSEHGVDVPMLKILGGSSIRQVSEEAVSKLSFTKKSTDSASEENKMTSKIQTATASAPEESAEKDHELMPHNKGLQHSSSSSLSPAISTPTGGSGSDKSSVSSAAVWEVLQKSDGLVPLRKQALSLGQSRLYFSSLYLDDDTPFNCTTSYRLSGLLDVSRLATALDMVIGRHEIFRTMFYTDEASGKAMQAVTEASRFNLKILHGCDDSADVSAEFQRIHQYNFNLAAGDTFIATLLSHTPTSHTIVFGYHHIIIDGVSWQLFLQDLGRFYRDPSSLLQLPELGQCIDFVEKQRQDIDSGDVYKERLQFWQGMFPDPPKPLPLFPFAKVTARRALTRYSMRDIRIPIDATLIRGIKRASVASRTTPFHFWLSGFQVLLQRLLGTGDLCVGIVDANRGDPTFSQTIGFLLEIMPVRFNVREDQDFADVLKETRSRTYGALAQSGVPIEELARACGVPADKTQTPFFQVIFNYRMGATYTPEMGDAQMSFLDYSDAKVPFDLAVSVDEKEDGTGFLTFSAQDYLYDQEAIDLLMATYKLLLAKFSADVSCRVDKVPMYDGVLVEKGVTMGTGSLTTRTTTTDSQPDTLSRRFNSWVAQDPDATAVRDLTGRGLTYLETSQRADAIALTLHNVGAGTGSRISVLCEPTVDTVAIILAIHRTGAAYVPLDIYANDQRLNDILDESSTTVLLHHSPTTARASKLCKGRAIHLLDTGAIGLPVQPFTDVSSPQDDAFVLYTSGSTGKPKGIPLTHTNVCTVITASTLRLSIGREVVLQQTGQGFDAAIWEIFVAVANGGTVIMSDNHGHPADIAALMERERVTVALLIISEAHTLLQYGSSALRRCNAWRVAICAGENFTPNLIDKIGSLNLPGLKVFNGYGPTETSIFSALGSVALDKVAGDYRVPIGAALPDYGMYVVDDEGLPVPVGWEGEVVICGPGVGSGYLNRPELTVAKWKPATFLAGRECSRRQGWDRLYHTGDRGRMLADGSVVILGRIDGDSQIKLRGFRVELDEVASCIIQTAAGVLTDARVTVRGDVAEHKFLVAFVVFSHDGGVKNETEYLHSLLAELPLPPYMRPAVGVSLSSLPFTERGKLDNKVLEQMELPFAPVDDEEQDGEGMTETEASLKRIWHDVIQGAGGIPVSIRPESDFFSVGGNSLLLLRLKAEVRSVFEVEISLAELFQSSTLQGLADRIQGSSSTSTGVVTQIDWEKETDPRELLRMSSESALVNSFSSATGSTAGGLSIVLTGATGFLGSAILRQLVSSPAISRIHCVAVRNTKRIDMVDSPKVTVHAGDLAQPLLGLRDEQAAAAVFGGVHVIIHNGAEVSHMKNYMSLRAANVGSTRELARLAIRYHNRSSGIPPFHFVSTGGVALLTGWDSLPEMRLPPHAVPPVDGSHGYVSSKWASERLLERLSEGLPAVRVVVHRPSNITGDDVSDQDIVHSVLRFSTLLRAVPDLGADFGTFDLIRVETVAEGLLKDVFAVNATSMTADSAVIDQRVMYRHQSGETIVPASQLKEYLGESDTTAFEVLDMEDWITAAKANGMDELVGEFLSASSGGIRMPLLEKGGKD